MAKATLNKKRLLSPANWTYGYLRKNKSDATFGAQLCMLLKLVHLENK
jgi:hypothetical protein